MSRELLLGIDAGTTAVKVALVDRELRTLDSSRRRIRSRHPHPGWVEQNAEEFFEAVVEAVAELLSRTDDEVVACGLDHQGESVVAWDGETKAALSPIVVWQCKRSTGILERLAAGGAEAEIQRRSGLPLDPYFSAGKLTWLCEEVPAVAAARAAGTLRLGTLDAFLCDRLGAGFETDVATASRTQLQALGVEGWDPWLCERFEVPAEALPRVRESAGSLGTLRHPSWNRELPLAARIVDQQAALAGTGCVSPGMAKATYGTGVFLLVHAGQSPPSPEHGLLPTVAWKIGDRVDHALDGGVFAAGALLEWLTEAVGLAEDPAGLCALAAEAPGSAGVRVLPAIAGLGAPWWSPEACGVVAGLTAAAGGREIARAALEGIAWRVTDILEAARKQVQVSALRVDGGLSVDPLLVSLQADTAGVPVERMDSDATVTGVALLAGVGVGLFDSPADAAPLLEVAERVEPSRDAAWRAAEHERWQRFVALARQM